MSWRRTYIQVGGLGGDTHPWCTRRTGSGSYQEQDVLADIVAGPRSPIRFNGRVELILGIFPSGASCLLMTEHQMRSIARDRLPYLRGRRQADDFVSMSPIEFFSAEELVKKLGTYTQKAKSRDKKIAQGVDFSLDSSQANKTYLPGGDAGVGRGAFEHGRLFYRILKNELDLDKFAVTDIWTQSVKLTSIAFNTWSADVRSPQERLKYPKILDVGWVDISVPDLFPQTNSSTHIVMSENKPLTNRGLEKMDFAYGDTKVLDHSALSLRVQQHFKSIRRATDIPVILLVNGESATCHMLKYFGVDVAHFESGIEALLKHKQDIHQFDRHETMSSRSQGQRRSRSPDRRGTDGYSSCGRRSPSGRHQVPEKWAPVYVIDVLPMVRSLMQSGDLTNARPVKLADILGLDWNSALAGWCAGNESHQIVDLWTSMIGGPVIDEQRAQRQAASAADGPLAQALPETSRRGKNKQPEVVVGILDGDWDDDDD